MTDFTITITSNLARASEAFKRAPARMNQLIEFAIERGAGTIAREARIVAPVAFKNLSQSIRAFRVGELHWRVSAGGEGGAKEVNYARAVEEGSKGGGWPHIDDIRAWIKTKRIAPHSAAITDRALPYVIRRAIYMRGSKAQPFMRPAFENNKDRVFQLIDRAVDQGLQEIFA